MSIGAKSRNSFFKSSGAASSPGFSSYWDDTASATVLPCAWDTPSGTADVQFNVSVSQNGTSTPKKSCILQMVYPAFGVLMDFNPPAGTPNSYLFQGSSIVSMGIFSKTSGNPPIATITVNCIAKVRIFNASNVLLFESGPTGTSAGGSVLPTTLKGVSWGVGASLAVHFAPSPTDYLVIEMGVAAMQSIFGGSPHNYVIQATAQVGDNHAAYQVINSTTAGNAGLAWNWWGVVPGGSPGGPLLLKPRYQPMLPQTFSFPTVDVPVTDILNGFIL